MKRILFIASFVSLSFAINDQAFKENHIVINEKIIAIGSDTMVLEKGVSKFDLKLISKKLNEKPKKFNPPREDVENNVTSYYFKKTGIICKAAKSDEKIIYPVSMTIQFDTNGFMYVKTKAYSGELEFYGLQINGSTTFDDIYKNPKIHPMIDHSRYGKDTCSYILIQGKHRSYSVIFNGASRNSPIRSFSTDL